MTETIPDPMMDDIDRMLEAVRERVRDNPIGCVKVTGELTDLLKELPPADALTVLSMAAGDLASAVRPDSPDTVLHAVAILNADRDRKHRAVWWDDLGPLGDVRGRQR